MSGKRRRPRDARSAPEPAEAARHRHAHGAGANRPPARSSTPVVQATPATSVALLSRTAPDKGAPTLGVPLVVPARPGASAQRSPTVRLRAAPRRRRVPVLAAALVVIVAAAAVAGYLELRKVHSGAPSVAASAAVRTQRTLLFAVGAPRRPAALAALLATDPVHKSGSVLLLPAQTLATVPGYGPSTVGGSFAHAGFAVPEATVSDLIGVTVEGTWRLSPAGLAALVDAVGGVQATVDVRIVGAHRRVLLEPGPQHLNGAQAVEFAGYLGAGEPAQAETARLQQVLDGILSRLPKTGLAGVLRHLGRASASTEPVPALATYLYHLVASDYSLNQQTVPLTTLDTGAATPSLEVDTSATHQFVEHNLAASVPAGSTLGNNLVQVENNTGDPGLVLEARSRIDGAKLDFIGSQDLTPLHTVAHTVVLIFNTSSASISMGQRVAAALGLPASAVKVSSQANDIANVVVILGRDYTRHR